MNNRLSENQNIRSSEETKAWVPGHERLWVWQFAHRLRLEIYEICKTIPVQEKYRTGDQIERSSNSVADNIAEGNSAYYFNDKIKSFCVSRKEAGETQNHLRAMEGKKYIPIQKANEMIEKYEEVIRGINGLIRRAANKRKSN